MITCCSTAIAAGTEKMPQHTAVERMQERAGRSNPIPTFVEISTPQGNILLLLYDETPKHRDMFVQAIRNGWYTGTEFNRIIPQFVIQGGMLDAVIEQREKMMDKPGPRIDAEFHDSLFHKKGALGAGRNDNPEKSSFVNQFYIVQGKKYTDAEMDELEKGRLKGRKIPAWKREVYRTTGGTPFLDNDYTIFGEVVQGLEVVDAIAATPTYENDHPKAPVKITLRVLKKKEAEKLAHLMSNAPE